MNAWEVLWRFGLISLLAFGGGAGTPLIERIAVRETGWITEREFAVAIGFGQVTPGPVMVVATFIGYRAAGLVGALAATLGVFLIPWALAAATAGAGMNQLGPGEGGVGPVEDPPQPGPGPPVAGLQFAGRDLQRSAGAEPGPACYGRGGR